MSTETELKAKEIVEKYRAEISNYHLSDWITEEKAKSCAIIHVQGIIDELPDTICGYMPEGGTAMEIDNYRKYFWRDVLNEINKL